MTRLRQRMLEDMHLRGLSARTQGAYVLAVRQLAEPRSGSRRRTRRSSCPSTPCRSSFARRSATGFGARGSSITRSRRRGPRRGSCMRNPLGGAHACSSISGAMCSGSPSPTVDTRRSTTSVSRFAIRTTAPMTPSGSRCPASSSSSGACNTFCRAAARRSGTTGSGARPTVRTSPALGLG
jgi:hypothetical protein